MLVNSPVDTKCLSVKYVCLRFGSSTCFEISKWHRTYYLDNI